MCDNGASTNFGSLNGVGSESFSMFVNSGDEVELIVRLNGNLVGTSATYEFEILKNEAKQVVGGQIIPIEPTSLILAGAQMTAAWMIPVIVSGIGFAIVIARKF